MKRDWDVVRFILTQVEAAESPIQHLDDTTYPNDVLGYHANLLVNDAKLIKGSCRIIGGTGGEYGYTLKNLNWDGHNFLEQIRDETVWEKTKEKLRSTGVAFTIETIKAVAGAIIKDQLKSIGIEVD